MDWIEDESVWLFCPDFADVFMRGETVEGLQAASEIISGDEVGEVGSQLLMGLIVIALHRGLLDGSVHSLDLAVRPRMIGFGQTVFDAVGSTDLVEAVNAITCSPAIAIARQIGELDAVIREHDVNPVWYGRDQGFQEAYGRWPISLLMQLDEGELRGAIDRNKEVEFALLGTNLGDVDVEIPDRVGLEFAFVRLVTPDLRQAGDAMPLQTAMQRRSGQMRDRRLERV